MIKQRKRLLWLWKKSFLQVEYSLDKVTTATISISITMTITRGQIMVMLKINKLQNNHLQLMFKSQLIIVQHLPPSDLNINSSKYLYWHNWVKVIFNSICIWEILTEKIKNKEKIKIVVEIKIIAKKVNVLAVSISLDNNVAAEMDVKEEKITWFLEVQIKNYPHIYTFSNL